MSRTIIDSVEDAINELDKDRKRPERLDRDLILPFSKLSGDEFEILCYRLLRAMYPNDRIYYYGKTSDMGRDIIHISANGHIRLIQCKNFQKM